MAEHATQVQRSCLSLLSTPPAGATPLWQIPFPALVLSPAQSQPVPISNPLAIPPSVLSFLFLLLARSPASSPFPLVVTKKFSTHFTKFACCLCYFSFSFCFYLHFILSPSSRLLSMIIFALFGSQRLLTFRLCRQQGEGAVSSSLGVRQLGSDCSQF